MFREFIVQLSMVLALAGVETFRREETTIGLDDLKKGLQRLKPREVVSYTSCKSVPSAQEKQEMYHILYKSFGPGINMTNDAFALLRGVVFEWYRCKHSNQEVEAG
jgi:hypothetical protein